MFNEIRALRSYRAHLLPLQWDGSNADHLADEGLLPSVRVKAANAAHAEALAHLATGKRVVRVERVEHVERMERAAQEVAQ